MVKENKQDYHCGYVAIIGRPNVGKSTILNNILKQKISITSKKPQTTQKQILGIKTDKTNQIIFIDTPGMHKDLVNYTRMHGKNSIAKYMSKSISTAIADVDLIIFVIAGTKWDDTELVLLDRIKQLKHKNTKLILVVNKVDLVKKKDVLLVFVDKYINNNTDIKDLFSEIFFIAAEKKQGLNNLVDNIYKYLPKVDSPDSFYFDYNSEVHTIQSSGHIASEIIREKIIRLLGDELPYKSGVEIISFENSDELLKLSAVIWVERKPQKTIIIGSQGEKIKAIGTRARLDLESYFGKKVYIDLWCKVKSNWSLDKKLLKNLGFEDE